MKIKESNFTSGHINDALGHLNEAITTEELRGSKMRVATHLDCCLNKLQTEWTASQSNRSDSLRNYFKGMVMKGIEIDDLRRFLSSPELEHLARLDPMVLDQGTLNDRGYIPGTELLPGLRKAATREHQGLRDAFNNIKKDPSCRDKVIEGAAGLLYTVRSNIAHGEKTASGYDRVKGERDESVCGTVVPVQKLLVELLLNAPSNRLLVYGTLAPNEPNHAVLASITGTWQVCTVRGSLRKVKELPVLTWDTNGAEVQAHLFQSPDLKAHWERIDGFEGSRYHRRLVLVKTSDGVCVANAYLAA